MDKVPRNQILGKMRNQLQTVTELTAKYVELPEFKRFSCMTQDQAVPPPKAMSKEGIEELSEAK